jgi:hypothetical protein
LGCGLYAAVALVDLVYGQVKAASQLAGKALGACCHVVGIAIRVARHAYHQGIGLPFFNERGDGGKAGIAFGFDGFDCLGGARKAVAYGHPGAQSAKVKS